MAFYLKLYLLTVPIFFIIDIIWLGFIARNIYQSKMGHLMGEVKWDVAILFYLIYIVGILFFAVIPAIEEQSLQKAISYGAFFGFITYATYDLTNWATLKGFPPGIVWIDLLWGTVLCALVSASAFKIGMFLK